MAQQKQMTEVCKILIACYTAIDPSILEALGAGAIPISIADDMMLPEGFDWDSAIIRIAEADIENIPDIISAISEEDEQNMRSNCLKIHDQLSGDNFVSVIRQYYNPNVKT